MSEKTLPEKFDVLGTVKEMKEYILGFAMLFAVGYYFYHKLHDEPPKDSGLLIGILFVSPFIVFLLCNVRPRYLKNRELNLRPTGDPDQRYFTTSPRSDDSYHFFAGGYEHYLEWLRQPHWPVLYLTGSSGSGKSSLINAYLAPQLEKDKSRKTNVYLLRSYHDPLRTLYQAMKMEEDPDPAIGSETVYSEISNASKMLSDNERILIVLDQFEEFFLLRSTSENSQGNEIAEGIAELKKFFKKFISNPPKRVHILLSYRDDFQELIDELELPARTENANFKQVNPLNFDRASKFLKNCPGFEIPEKQLKRVLSEAASIDTPVTLRPIVLNMLGIILQQMIGQGSIPRLEGNLIRKYILDSLSTELRLEKATVLKAMLTDFNTARPRTLHELTRNSGLNVSQLDNQMIIMQHQGLVRCLDITEPVAGKRKWQIAHDFVALQIEKVVAGVRNTFWQTAKPWLAPVLTCLLILLTSSYYSSKEIRDEKRRIEEEYIAIGKIESANFNWTQNSKQILAGGNAGDSAIHELLPYFITLQPDILSVQVFPMSFDNRPLFTNFKELGQLKSLTKIIVYYNTSLTSLDGLNGLTNLKELNITNCNNLVNVNGINGLTNLEKLDLSYCNALQNIDSLGGLTGLTQLQMLQDTNLVNVNALKNLLNLKKLNLGSCFALQEVGGLKNLVNLEYLDLSYCYSLKDIDELKDLANLKWLNVRGSRKVPKDQIDALKKSLPNTTIHNSFDDPSDTLSRVVQSF